MKIPQIYIDTSVFGGAFDKEFQRASLQFFKQIREGSLLSVISSLVAEEVEIAPTKVKDLFAEIFEISSFAQISHEAVSLQEAYLKAGIVTPNSRIDALHVALATVSDCSMIVSWNFKHIVHYQKIPLYNGINQMQGCKQIGIYSPLEVINNE